MESRTQGSRPKGQGQGPRTKKSEAKARTALPRTDPLEAKDRNVRGQGPRTQSQVFSKKTEKVFKIFFRRSEKKENRKGFRNFPRGFWRFPT